MTAYLMRDATVVQVLQDLFYVLLHVLFYLWSLPYRLHRGKPDTDNQKWYVTHFKPELLVKLLQ